MKVVLSLTRFVFYVLQASLIILGEVMAKPLFWLFLAVALLGLTFGYAVYHVLAWCNVTGIIF